MIQITQNNILIPEILIDKLTRAELHIYIEINKISKVAQSNTVNVTIEYLTQHTEYRSKSFVSKNLQRLVDKGLLVRDIVQSNTNRHKCYQYYIVQDIILTNLYQSLAEEDQKKYVKQGSK